MTVGFGYVKDDRDDRDWDFDRLGLGEPDTSDRVQLYEWDPYNQGATNSCVGQAAAGSLYLAEHTNRGKSKKPCPWVLYEQARRISRPKGKLEDRGTRIRDCFKALKALGCCDDSLWPAKKDINSRPNILMRFRGHGRKGGDYYKIKDASGSARVRAILAALNAGHPVVFGTAVSNEFRRARGVSPLTPVPKDGIVGYHALVISGYRRDADGQLYFRVRNSWGTSWGQRGYAWLSDGYINWSESSDFWVVTNWRNVR